MRVNQSRELICPAGIRVVHKIKYGRFAIKPHEEVEVSYILCGSYHKVASEMRVNTTIQLQTQFESYTVIEHRGGVYHIS